MSAQTVEIQVMGGQKSGFLTGSTVLAILMHVGVRQRDRGQRGMMGIKERQFMPLERITLEQLVPQDNFYRQVERTLDLSFVR